ncbi:hypothetical protein L6164_035393 [Bauhinia variegata]|uniref:Uncharacterized protein n=1 Tax=Bauhinia variegata TaxID=167791 RepID=A0ACB9KDU9_BAUVA|nr:hypothetical protein L6164_035393 [Bauhinia variegata]
MSRYMPCIPRAPFARCFDISPISPFTVHRTDAHPSRLNLTLTSVRFTKKFSFLSETISDPQAKKNVYSVWAIPPEDVGARVKKLMSGLRSEFGGPEFEPHITVVGAISLTADDALNKFRSACEGLKAYNATVDRVATGTFFYQCVYLLIHPTTEVVETSDHSCKHFGYVRPSAYMPHLSLLYQDLSDDEKKKVQERANALDDGLSGLSFQINRLALYKTDTEDKTLKSWQRIAEFTLPVN